MKTDFFEKELKKRKRLIEKILKQIAKKDEKIKDNWKAIFPLFGEDISLEAKADEVEEYDQRVLQEHFLELKLKEIKEALQKIKKGTYGICEKCGKEIEKERLKILPEAKFCSKCKK